MRNAERVGMVRWLSVSSRKKDWAGGGPYEVVGAKFEFSSRCKSVSCELLDKGCFSC